MRPTVLVLALVLAAACDRPGFTVGVECTLNSDCGDPLVCRLERCRRQCVDSRDCGAGLLCLRVGDQGGVCQLPSERECDLSDECPAPLVCRFQTCTTECAENRDCPPGATCAAEGDAGVLACMEVITESCVYDSDCPGIYLCNDDQRCVPECREARDCAEGWSCIAETCVAPDGG